MANLLQEAHKEERKDVQQHRLGFKSWRPSARWDRRGSIAAWWIPRQRTDELQRTAQGCDVDMVISADAVSSMNLIEQIMDEQLNLFEENYELYYEILDKLNKHCTDVAQGVPF